MVINMWQKIVKKGAEMLKVMCLGLMLVVMPSVWAKASFLIWPIYPVIESTERATALWLENTGNQAALVQVRVFKWDQEALEDVYVEQQQADRRHRCTSPLLVNSVDRQSAARCCLMSTGCSRRSCSNLPSTRSLRHRFHDRRSVPSRVHSR